MSIRSAVQAELLRCTARRGGDYQQVHGERLRFLPIALEPWVTQWEFLGAFLPTNQQLLEQRAEDSVRTPSKA